MINYPEEYYINSFRERGHKWNLTDVKHFYPIRDRWIEHNTTGYQSIYSFEDKDRTKVYYNYWFLDFDVEDGDKLVNCYEEANKVAEILTKSYDLNINMILSGGKGYHLEIIFPKPLILPVKVANKLSEVFWNFIHDCFKTKYLCESCIKPVKRIRRIPGTVHENGNHCKQIKEYKGSSTKRLDLLIQKKLIDLTKPKQTKDYIQKDTSKVWGRINLLDVYRDIGKKFIVIDDNDTLKVKHPDHFNTHSETNGVVNPNLSYCYSTNKAYNKFENLILLLGTKKNAIEYLNEHYGEPSNA